MPVIESDGVMKSSWLPCVGLATLLWRYRLFLRLSAREHQTTRKYPPRVVNGDINSGLDFALLQSLELKCDVIDLIAVKARFRFQQEMKGHGPIMT